MFRSTLVVLAALGTLSLPVLAQPANPTSLGGPAASQAEARYSANELDLLLKPVALYPDPLLAQLLPAAAFPAQIEAAAQWLKDNPDGDPEGQEWDESVQALAHYPEVLDQLAQDLAWTEALGQATASQMNEVTGSIQRLRTQAYAAGNLQSDENMTVSVDEGYVTIVPNSQEQLAVPVYNSSVVYGCRPVGWSGPMINYGGLYNTGSWLVFGFDWVGRSCFRYPSGGYYGSYSPCSVNVLHNTYNGGNCRSWRPSYGYNTVRYNNFYRPGNAWNRVPGCSNGVGFQRNNFYRPGGNWSRQVGSGWNQPRNNWSNNRNWVGSNRGNWANNGWRGHSNWNNHNWNRSRHNGWANNTRSNWSNHNWSRPNRNWSNNSNWGSHRNWSRNTGFSHHNRGNFNFNRGGFNRGSFNRGCGNFNRGGWGRRR